MAYSIPDRILFHLHIVRHDGRSWGLWMRFKNETVCCKGESPVGGLRLFLRVLTLETAWAVYLVVEGEFGERA